MRSTTAQERALDLFHYILAKRLPVKELDQWTSMAGTFNVEVITALGRRMVVKYRGNTSNVEIFIAFGDRYDIEPKKVKRFVRRIVILDDKNMRS